MLLWTMAAGIAIVALVVDVLLRKYLSVLIFGAGVLSALAFGSDLKTVAAWSLKSLVERHTLELVGLVYLVLLLGLILEAKDSLSRMVEGLTGILKKNYLIITLAPALLGLLPMPGGALVSAPILKKALGEAGVSAELKTFTNYWWRHIWEYAWPLYPGLILTAAIFGVEVISVIRVQFYFTLVAAGLGALSVKLYFKRFGQGQVRRETFRRNLRLFMQGSWEILLVVALIVGLRLYMLAALALVVMLSLLLLRAGTREKLSLLRKSVNIQVLAVLVAVMIFKNLIVHSDLAQIIKSLVGHAESYRTVILFAIPFLIGFLTGVNQSFAGIAFPVLVPIVGIENPNLTMIAFLYVSGFAGVLLSPVHLCLVLSSEYYGASLAGVFKYLVPPVIILILLAVLFFGLWI
jgi:integral membrane protein (TIGR00529 family)